MITKLRRTAFISITLSLASLLQFFFQFFLFLFIYNLSFIKYFEIDE